MSKTLGDFMKDTGGNFTEAQKLFQASRQNGTSQTSVGALSSPPGSRAITETINNTPRTGLTGIHTPYNPYTGGHESINASVGVNQGQYGMTEKQQLWERSGNTGSFNMDAFYRGNDGSLQIKPQYRKTIEGAQSIADINAYFNQTMIERHENRNIRKPTPEGFAKYNEAYGHMLTGGQTAPKPYSAVEDLENRRREYGMEALENQIAQINREMADMQTRTRERADYAEAKAVPMGVIAGRVSEIERQGNTRLQYLRNEATYLNDQYKTKLGVIEMMMKAGGEDYERVKTAFDDQWKRNRDMLEMYQQDTEREYNQERERQKDAQATIATVYNGIMSGGINTDAWSESMENTIAKLEVQAGYPMGLFKSVIDKNPKSDIVGQSTVNTGGRQVLNLVMRDKVTGAMRVENIDMGAANEPTDTNRYQYKDDGVVFDTRTGNVRHAGSVDGADFRGFASKYPREASLKNNNPAGITWSQNFAALLDQHGIQYYKGTARPANEGGHYFGFPTVGEGMKAYDLLWSSPSYQNLTVGKALDRWGTGSLSISVNKNKRIADLSDEERQELQHAQLRKESPGFYKELMNMGGGKKGGKSDEKFENEVASASSSLLASMQKGSVSFDEAHAQLYTKYGARMKDLGYSDAQVKNILFNGLGGIVCYEKYKNKKSSFSFSE